MKIKHLKQRDNKPNVAYIIAATAAIVRENEMKFLI